MKEIIPNNIWNPHNQFCTLLWKNLNKLSGQQNNYFFFWPLILLEKAINNLILEYDIGSYSCSLTYSCSIFNYDGYKSNKIKLSR